MRRLFLFNPSHEMALAANSHQYTPSKHVQVMESDLAMLPLLWANEEDCILTDLGIVDIKGNKIKVSPNLVPIPWGWNKSVKHRFQRLGIDDSLMPTDEELDEWREFSSRKWAAQYNKVFYERVGQKNWLVENKMQFCNSSDDIDTWFIKNKDISHITKSEYSSSGRGNRIDDKKKSGSVVIDEFYDKTLDFALEFEASEKDVHYMGLSLFEASREGKYAFNYLCSQEELKLMVCDRLSLEGKGQLDFLIKEHETLLQETLAGHYRGIIGIDMMVVKGGLIHPCVEINLRMNMGVLAMILNERGYKEIDRKQIGGTKFYPVIEGNRFFIGIN